MSLFGGGSFFGGIGGMFGGALGSMFGPLGAQLGRMIGSALGQMFDGLISQFGQSNVQNALNNTFMDGIFNGLSGAISQSILPPFAKDQLSDAVDQVRQSTQAHPTPHACQRGVDDAIGGAAEDYGRQIGNEMMNCVLDDGDESKKGKNWLVALAEGLAKVQGKHLENMLQAQFDMENSTSDKTGMSKEEELKAEKEDAKAFTEAQGRFTAESKLFGMVTEAAANAIKAVGEGLSSMARKQ
jgi:hypothetical protein